MNLDSVLAGTGQWSEGMRTISFLGSVLGSRDYRRNSLRGWTMVVRESGMEGARRRSGAAPLALLSTVLACGMSGNTLRWKTQWLVSALALASAFASSSSNRFRKRVPVV